MRCREIALVSKLAIIGLLATFASASYVQVWSRTSTFSGTEIALSLTAVWDDVRSNMLQVKFFYKDDAMGTGQSWSAHTPKDRSCSPCTNLVSSATSGLPCQGL